VSLSEYHHHWGAEREESRVPAGLRSVIKPLCSRPGRTRTCDPLRLRSREVYDEEPFFRRRHDITRLLLRVNGSACNTDYRHSLLDICGIGRSSAHRNWRLASGPSERVRSHSELDRESLEILTAPNKSEIQGRPLELWRNWCASPTHNSNEIDFSVPVRIQGAVPGIKLCG